MKTNKWILGLVTVSALTWAACDDDDDNILDKPNLNETDETFVEVAARNNMAEIEFGELAVTKSTDSTVRVFAQKMIDEHQAAQDELEDLADDYAGIEWPNDLDEGHDEIMEHLNEAEAGLTFDSLYLRTQVTVHESAAGIFQTATGNTTDARVKAYANKYLPVIEMHQAEADSLHTAIVAQASDDTDDTADDTGTDDTDDGTN